MPAHPSVPLLALTLLLAGCSGPSPSGGEDGAVPGGPAGAEGAAGPWNYTTMHPGAAPYARDYEGTLTAQEALECDCPPTGPAAGGVDTCCYYDWIAVDDLLVTDQLTVLRINVTWTNTQQDSAGLDAATCLPWFCESFVEDTDESAVPGPHLSTMELFTAGRADFLENVGGYSIGVRFQNAHVATALPYQVHVEAHPVADGLGLFDPYLIDVPENATVTAELVGPYRQGGVEAGFLVYDEADRPVQWHRFTGAHGSRHEVEGLEGGRFVVFPMLADGGFVRFSVDREPAALRMERLAEEFGTVPVATVPDAQAHDGTFTYEAPPASLDTFPFFLHADGASAQAVLGVPTAGAVRGSAITLASSSGTIADVQQMHTSVSNQAQFGRICLQCNTLVDFQPQNYLDDDGVYQVEWSVQGSAGEYVLFTARYLR